MHPCWNGSLQTGTKVVAIVDLAFSILVILFGVLIFPFKGDLTSARFDKEGKISREDKEAAVAAFMILAIVLVVVGAMYVLLAALLFVGATKRNQTFCLVWFVINFILLILGVLRILRDITSEDNKRNAVSSSFGLLLQSYFLWVVWAFMSELKEESAVSPNSHPKPRV